MTSPRSIHWQLSRPDDALLAFLRGDWRSRAVVVKKSQVRTVYRVQPVDRTSGLPALFIKHDHPAKWRDKIKALWRCKSRIEYEAGSRLAAASVPCVPMLGWARRGSESWLVTRAVRGTSGFLETWRECRRDRVLRRAFIIAWARLIRRLFRAGVVHDDLHRDNILVARKGARMKMLLVDVYEARTGLHDPRRSLRGLMLTLSGRIPELRQREIDHLLRASGINKWSDDPRREWDTVLTQACRHTLEYRHAGTEKALRISRYCRQVKTEAGTWLLWRPTALAACEAIVREHQRIARDAPEQLIERGEAGQECVTSRIMRGRRTLIVHEYPRSGENAESAAKPRWIAAFRAYGAGLFVSPHLAWLAAADRDYVIREDLAGVPLTQAITANPAAAPRLLAATGRMFAHYHEANIMWLPSADELVAVTKPRNRLCEIGIADPRRLQIEGKVYDEDRTGDLRDLCASLPPQTSSRGKAHLIAAYRRRAGWSREKMRTVLKLAKSV